MTSSLSTDSISLTLNGEPRQFRAAATVADLVRDIGLDPAKVAVERNLEIVSRSTLENVHLADGDVLEIVHFVGGGQDDGWSVAGRHFTSRLIVTINQQIVLLPVGIRIGLSGHARSMSLDRQSMPTSIGERCLKLGGIGHIKEHLFSIKHNRLLARRDGPNDYDIMFRSTAILTSFAIRESLEVGVPILEADTTFGDGYNLAAIDGDVVHLVVGVGCCFIH